MKQHTYQFEGLKISFDHERGYITFKVHPSDLCGSKESFQQFVDQKPGTRYMLVAAAIDDSDSVVPIAHALESEKLHKTLVALMGNERFVAWSLRNGYIRKNKNIDKEMCQFLHIKSYSDIRTNKDAQEAFKAMVYLFKKNMRHTKTSTERIRNEQDGL